MRKVGDRVKVAKNNDNDCYDSFRDEVLIITYVSLNKKDHPGYDEGVGEPLYDFVTEDGREVHNSLYEYEVEDAE